MTAPMIRTKSGFALPLSVLVDDILDLLDGNGAIITEPELAAYELTAYLRATFATEEDNA